MSEVKQDLYFYKRCTSWSVFIRETTYIKLGAKLRNSRHFIWMETSKMASRRRSEGKSGVMQKHKNEYFLP